MDKSQRQERRGAKALGGRPTPASGALDGWKGDVQTATEMVEFKRTDKKSISLKQEWLEKVAWEGYSAGKKPLLGLEIGGKNYVILPEDEYVYLRDESSRFD